MYRGSINCLILKHGGILIRYYHKLQMYVLVPCHIPEGKKKNQKTLKMK